MMRRPLTASASIVCSPVVLLWVCSGWWSISQSHEQAGTLQAGEEDREEVQFEPMLVFGAGKEAAFAAEAKALWRSLHKVQALPWLSTCDLQGGAGTLAGMLGLAHAGGYSLAWPSWELPLRCLLETAYPHAGVI